MKNLSLTFFEIDLPRCSKEYGITCDAEIGVTGETKCLNCASTCQDVANYEEEIQVLRLAKNSQHIPNNEFQSFNIIESVNINPQKIFPGENLGTREKGKVSCNNRPESDAWFDRYIDHRLNVDGYNPALVGTFLGRLDARYPNMEGFSCRLLNGRYEDSSNKLSALETRHYIIEKTNYDGDSTTFEFTDALTFVENGKALLPIPNDGILSSDIGTGSGISFTIEPSGIGDEQYETSGRAAIDKEVVSFTRSGDTITLTGRGLDDTEVKTHKEGATFQQGVHLNGNAAQIFNQILEPTDTPADYYDFESWQNEVLAYNPRLYSSWEFIPSDITKYFNDLIIDAALQVQTDVVLKKIKMKVLRKTLETFSLKDENCYNIEIETERDKRISAIFTQYGKLNPLEKTEDGKNYVGKSVRFDDNPQNLLQKNIPKIRSRYSRFIQSTGRQAVSDINKLMISRYNKPMRIITLVTRSDLSPPQLGDIGSVNFRRFENQYGFSSTIPVQVIQRKLNYPEVELVLEEYGVNYMEDNDTNTRIISITSAVSKLPAAGSNGITLRSLHDAEWGPGAIATGTTIIFETDPDVMFGQRGLFGFALRMGDWPETADGVTIRVKNCKIYGRGGFGTRLFDRFGAIPDANSLSRGGHAFYTRWPVILENCIIASGGGGGGGAIIFGNPSPTGYDNSVWGKTLEGAPGAGYIYKDVEILQAFLKSDGKLHSITQDPYNNPWTPIIKPSLTTGGERIFVNGGIGFVDHPSISTKIITGKGGDLGQAGEDCPPVSDPNQHPKLAVALPAGPPGNAIDGISYCTTIGCTILGPTVN